MTINDGTYIDLNNISDMIFFQNQLRNAVSHLDRERFVTEVEK
jgi:hypothetical protein